MYYKIFDVNKIILVKYDYDSFSEEWKRDNPNPFDGVVFAFFGEISNMKGHAYLQNIKTGEPAILHLENITELTEDEL